MLGTLQVPRLWSIICKLRDAIQWPLKDSPSSSNMGWSWIINQSHFVISVCACVPQPWPALCNPMDCSPPGFSVHGDSPGKSTGVGCDVLLQGIFPTQGLNPSLLGLLQGQVGFSPLESPGKPNLCFRYLLKLSNLNLKKKKINRGPRRYPLVVSAFLLWIPEDPLVWGLRFLLLSF